jgi:hypothetical protein
MSDTIPVDDEMESPQPSRRRDKGLPPRAWSRKPGRYQLWVLVAGYGWTCAHAGDSYDDAVNFAHEHVARDSKVVQVEIRTGNAVRVIWKSTPTSC